MRQAPGRSYSCQPQLLVGGGGIKRTSLGGLGGSYHSDAFNSPHIDASLASLSATVHGDRLQPVPSLGQHLNHIGSQSHHGIPQRSNSAQLPLGSTRLGVNSLHAMQMLVNQQSLQSPLQIASSQQQHMSPSPHQIQQQALHERLSQDLQRHGIERLPLVNPGTSMHPQQHMGMPQPPQLSRPQQVNQLQLTSNEFNLQGAHQQTMSHQPLYQPYITQLKDHSGGGGFGRDDTFGPNPITNTSGHFQQQNESDRLAPLSQGIRKQRQNCLKRQGSDNSIQADKLFSAADANNNQQETGNGKNQASLSHLSIMSLSIGDGLVADAMKDFEQGVAGGLSTRFDQSLRLGTQKVSDNRTPIKRTSSGSADDTEFQHSPGLEMSVATLGASDYGDMSIAKMNDSQANMSFSNIFEDNDGNFYANR
jgi:hypothetical protein